MGIRIFISEHSGNQKIENSQQKILMVLRTRDIDLSTIDISAPGMQNQRTFMRERGKRKEGQRNVIPPQIFNGEEYRGDFDDFDVANEDDVLEEFLGIQRKRPKIVPVNTGRVAEEVEKRKVGKLELEEKNINQGDSSEEIEEVDWVVLEENDPTTEPYQNGETLIEPPTLEELSMEDIVENKILISIVDENTSDDTADISESDDIIQEYVEEVIEEDAGTQYITNIQEDIEIDKEEKREDKVTDILVNGDNVHEIVEDTISNASDSDESDTDSDDGVDEYMADGEIQRKNTRGFKLLKNSKRFWKATLMMGHA